MLKMICCFTIMYSTRYEMCVVCISVFFFLDTTNCLLLIKGHYNVRSEHEKVTSELIIRYPPRRWRKMNRNRVSTPPRVEKYLGWSLHPSCFLLRDVCRPSPSSTGSPPSCSRASSSPSSPSTSSSTPATGGCPRSTPRGS